MHLRRIGSSLLVTALAAVAFPAFAETGMPQLDPTWYPNQLFWLAVSFAVIYLAVSSFIAPSVSGVLGEREQAISEAIARAEEYKASAAGAKGDFEQASAEARAKAAQILAEAQAETAREAADAMQTLNEELAKRTQAAERALAAATAKAQGELESSAAGLAQVMSEKLLGAKVDKTAAATAVAPLMKKAS